MTGDHQPFDLATTGRPGQPDLLFVHASGFCKEIWYPIARRIEEKSPHVVWRSVDIRGHGDSPEGEPPYRWDLLAGDVLKTLRPASPMLGIGHSIGGTLVTRAAIERPDLFHGLVLIEPIIFPPPHARRDLPLAVLTERRRAVFRDRQAAYDAFAERSFRSWDPETLAAYVDYGFEDTALGWALKCRPEVEADMYREGANHDTWEHAPELEVPVTIIVGGESDTHREPYLGALAEQFTDATVIVVEGAGHFVPMEKPQAVADLIAAALESR
ncbi:MAG: alpha/beta hydrolase [Acidimicrobiia bacterium]|nr:MAG: alpha/beta hydrolase [Acidimicrobiia bacterium]